MKSKKHHKDMLTLDAVVGQMEGIPSTSIGDEIAFMNPDKSKYYGLDSIGSRIWHLIKEPKTVGDIISVLIDEYDVVESACAKDVLELIQKLYEEDLINVV